MLIFDCFKRIFCFGFATYFKVVNIPGYALNPDLTGFFLTFKPSFHACPWRGLSFHQWHGWFLVQRQFWKHSAGDLKVVLVYEHGCRQGNFGQWGMCCYHWSDELARFPQTYFKTLFQLWMEHAYFYPSTSVYLVVCVQCDSKDFLYLIRGYWFFFSK